MEHPSRSKKKKITIIASTKGIEIAEKALLRLGFETKSNLAKSQVLSRSTVTKFFNRQPIQVDSFTRICKALTLNWKEIWEQTEKEQSEQLQKTDCSILETNEGGKNVQTLIRKVTVIDKENKKIKAEIILEGDINSVNNDLRVTLELLLQKDSGYSIKITDIKKGSIRLIVEGSQEDIEQLLSRIKSEELKEVNGFPIKDIQILDKWHLVQEIASHGAVGQNLSDADLSDADLSGADLIGADLSGADLSGADLIGADLIGADLSGAHLRNANLSLAHLSGAHLSGAHLSWAHLRGAHLNGAHLRSANLNGAHLSWAHLRGAHLNGAHLRGADLRGADLNGAHLNGAHLNGAHLRGADLNGAHLSGADVKNARFGYNVGISKEMRLDLIKRGAIFEDSPNDRSRSLTPVR